MSQRTIYIFVLLFYTLSTLGTAEYCHFPLNQQSKIKSGQIVLQAQQNMLKNANVTYQLTYKEQFNENPSIGFGINGFNISPSETIGLQIRINKISSSKAKFEVAVNSNNNWKKIRINFFATSRTDIEIGMAEYRGVCLNNTAQLKYNMLKKWGSQSSLKYKIFLSGFKIKTVQNNIRLTLQKSLIQEKSITIVFTVPYATRQTQEFFLSLIIFDGMNPSFRFSQGALSQTYLTSKLSLQVNKQGLSQMRTYIIGLTSLDIGATATTLSLDSSMNSNFKIEFGPNNSQQKGCEIKYMMVSYLIISVYEECGACLNFNLVHDGKCVDRCPSGYYVKLGKCEPKICPKGSYLSFQSNNCQKCPKHSNIKQCQNACPEGTTLDSQTYQCRPTCPSQNEVYSYDQCICKNGYYRIDNKCSKCPTETKYDYISKKCINICQQNFIFSNGGCKCREGYYMYAGKCVTCKINQVFDIAWGCRKNCGANMIYDGKSCICQIQYYEKQGNCYKCQEGYSYDKSKKQCVSKCLPQQTWKVKSCVCIKDYYHIQGKCKKCQQSQQYDSKIQNCKSKCLNGQIWNKNNKKCQCKIGTYLISGNCQACPTGTSFNEKNQKCQEICKQDFQQYINNKCQCITNYYREGSKCVSHQCVQNSYYSKSSQTCICNKGFILNKKSLKCEPEPVCPKNSKINNGVCTCDIGYYMNKNNQCLKCDNQNFQIFNGVECQCKDGYVRNINKKCVKIVIPTCKENQYFDLKDKICYCKQGFDRINKECVISIKCKQNQYWNGRECVCESGYIKSSNSSVCKKVTVQPPTCPLHSQFNGQKCVCIEKYFEYEPGLCATCPPNMTWNGKKCAYSKQCWEGYKWNRQTECCVAIGHQCPQNSKWNGNACQCIKEYYSIDGKCIKCEEGFKFDGVGCSKIQKKDEDIQCIGVNRILTSGKCICQPDTYQYNGICIQCTYPSVWNGVYCQGLNDGCFTLPNSVMDPLTRRCKCKNGYKGISGTCVLIPGYLEKDGVIYWQRDGYRWAGPSGTNADVLFRDQSKNQYPYNINDYSYEEKNKNSKKNKQQKYLKLPDYLPGKQKQNTDSNKKGQNSESQHITHNSDIFQLPKPQINKYQDTTNQWKKQQKKTNNNYFIVYNHNSGSNGNYVEGNNNVIDGSYNDINGDNIHVNGNNYYVQNVKANTVQQKSQFQDPISNVVVVQTTPVQTTYAQTHPVYDSPVYIPPSYTPDPTNIINGIGHKVEGKYNKINGNNVIVIGNGNQISSDTLNSMPTTYAYLKV